MDYVLEPKKICDNFTLMEALNWVAFRMPAIENDYNHRDLFYFQHFESGFNIFESPRTTFKPCASSEEDDFSMPESPAFPEIRTHVIVGLEEVDVGHYKKKVVNKEGETNLDQYREESREKITEYEGNMADNERQITALLDKAHDLLMAELVTGNLRARGRLKAVLNMGLKFQEADDKDWSHINSIPLDFDTNISEVPYSLRPSYPQVQNVDVTRYSDGPLYEYSFNERSPIIPHEAWEGGNVYYGACQIKSQFGWYEEVFFSRAELFAVFPPEKEQTMNVKVSSGVIYAHEAMFSDAKNFKRFGRPTKVPNHEFENELRRLYDINGGVKVSFYVQCMREFCLKQFEQPYSDSALEQKVSPILNKLKKTKNV